MKTKWPAIGLACVLLASGSLLANRAGASPDPATPAVRVTAKITPESVRIVARSSAPFTYSTSRPSDRLIVIDLPGAVAAEASHAQMLFKANVGSYRLVPYTNGTKSGLRLEVLLSGPAQPRFERTSSDELDLVFDVTDGTASPVTPVSVRQPAIIHSSPARISRVSVSTQGQLPGVQIEGSGDFHYHATRIDNPTRLVLDFADTTLVSSANNIAGDSALIRNIRVGQFQSDVARVVIELERWSPYTVTTSKSGLIVAFGSSPNATNIPATSLRAENSKPASVKSDTSVKSVNADAPVLPLPTWLTQPTFGFASQLPSAPPAPAPSQQSQTMAVPTQSMTPSSAAQASPKYTGEPIRVNFKDVDLQDFFRLIHEVSGLNVVLDPSVKGSVTLVMEDVPWDQVLDIVLRNNNLDKQLDGNVLRIASKSTLKAEADQKVALIAAEAGSEPIITVTRRLSYAKASSSSSGSGAGKQMQTKSMEDLLKPFLSARGSVFGDARTNTIIIRDIQSTIPKIDDLIKQLDRKSQQVEIEARVVLASRSFAQELGTQIGIAGVSGGNSLSGSNEGASPLSHAPPAQAPPIVSAGTTSLPLLTNLGATAATSGLAFEHMAGSFAIDLIISAAESKGVGKLLSAPKVVTQNNTEGIAQQGTQIPIQTNINNTISTQYISAVLMLKVTPQITADGTVFMIVHIENTQIDSGIPAILGQPALSTQSVDDQVLAKDGETIMLGGVMVNSQTTQYDQVPLLGSVPVIGNLFKHRTISVQSQELWFFLTPRVTQD
jgi:type IV pilus secretin PilQ/predicted competence protein